MTNRHYSYVVCLEIPEVHGSGSAFTRFKTTESEEEAFRLLKDDRNRLERVYRIEGKRHADYYNDVMQVWEEEH